MDKMKTARGFAKACAVLLKIAEVFCVIGFIGSLIGLVSLAALPRDLVEVEFNTGANITVHMADWLGQTAWREVRDSAKEALRTSPDEELVVTDDGMEIRAAGNRTLGRGELALGIAPAILDLAVAWYFCRTLGKLLRGIRDGNEPFSKDNADLLRTCGVTLFVGAAGPTVVYGVMEMFADVIETRSINLIAVFAGLICLGLAALFEAAAGRNLTESAPPAAPFGGYSGFAGTPAEPPAPDEMPEQVPAPGNDENDPPETPNAF
ncbi:MAG: hypothetical protein J6Z79_07265 [Clostridia bacterium]|nr:hypothetical protein [Clostridia bacterium]